MSRRSRDRSRRGRPERRFRSPSHNRHKRNRSRSRNRYRRSTPAVVRNDKHDNCCETIIIRGLGSAADEYMVESALRNAGVLVNVEKIHVVRDVQSGDCRGFAFVEFTSSQQATSFVDQYSGTADSNFVVNNWPVRIEFSSTSHKRGANEEDDWVCPDCSTKNFKRRNLCFRCELPRPTGNKRRYAVEENRTIQIMHLPPDVTSNKIKLLLQDLARVRNVTFAKDPTTGALKGYCYAELDNPRDVERVVRATETSPITIDGQVLRISEPSVSAEDLNFHGNVPSQVAVASSHDSEFSSGTPNVAAAPLVAEFPPVFEKADVTYTFDPRTGLYYEHTAGFYYDARSRLYYSTMKQQYFRVSESGNGFVVFIPPPPSEPIMNPADSLADDVDQFLGSISSSFQSAETSIKTTTVNSSKRDNSSSATMEVGQDPQLHTSSKPKHHTTSKQESAHSTKVLSDNPSTNANNRNNTLTGSFNTEQPKGEIAKPVGYRVKNLVSIQIKSAPLPAAGNVEQVHNRESELIKSSSSASSQASKKKKAGTKTRKTKDSVIVTTATRNLKAHNTRIQQWNAMKVPICTLCRRKFKYHATLVRHQQESELHKENLAKQRDLKRKKMSLPISEAAPNSTKEATAAAKVAGYRDRAADRRQRFGQDARTKSLRSETIVVDAKQGEPKPLDTNQNKGALLLKAMGWQEGESLGKHNEGITEPIAPTLKIGTSGLGSLSEILPGDSQKQVARKTTLQRYEDLK